MNSGRFGLILIIGVIFLFSACTGANEPPLIDTPVPAAIDLAAIYSSNCASCHGADRSGARGPSLLPARLTKVAPSMLKRLQMDQNRCLLLEGSFQLRKSMPWPSGF